MKKQLFFLLSCAINFLLSIFSYFYLCFSITCIAGTTKGNAYEIQQPEKGTYLFIGVSMLVVYILIGLVFQYVLYKLSKQSKKKYVTYMSVIYITGIIIGYFYSLTL